MKMPIYSIKDLKTGYLPPIHDVNDDSAIRSFRFACEHSKDSLFYTNPGDYQLWKIGDFETDTGEFISDLKFIIDAPIHSLEEEVNE